MLFIIYYLYRYYNIMDEHKYNRMYDIADVVLTYIIKLYSND